MSRAPITAEILIVGAGVLGLCTAVELTRRGREVRVLDPGGANASSVAAGMIAPALEAALDDLAPEPAALFRQARALWDGFAADLGLVLNTEPARWIGEDVEVLADRLAALGYDVAREGGGLTVPQDVQVEPEPAMAAMVRALRSPLLRGQATRVEAGSEGWMVFADDDVISTRTLVVATGAAGALPGIPDAVAALLGQIAPVRGQIGWTPERRSMGVRRTRGAYVVPSRGGVLIGATMEPGRRDLTPDAAAGAALVGAAGPLLEGSPLLQGGPGPVEWRVGVRGATPDGLPMAGWSGFEGLYLAVAPRRNGWLLGPLVGRVVADAITGKDCGVAEEMALDPRRFS